MQNVMKKAWEIAREGQIKFGGKVKEYFSAALRMAWSIVNRMEKMRDVVKNVSVREWSNYGKQRLYIDASISLIEQKEVKGNVVGAPRKITGRWYYDLIAKEMFRTEYREHDMSVSDDEVVKYMRNEIKKMVWGKVENA